MPNSRKRRRYTPELKAQILAECDQSDVSVAKVALSHGINANIVHGWRKLAREAGEVASSAQFVQIAVPSVVAERAGTQGIDVELRRSGITVKLSWTASEMDLAAWLRELLR